MSWAGVLPSYYEDSSEAGWECYLAVLLSVGDYISG